MVFLIWLLRSEYAPLHTLYPYTVSLCSVEKRKRYILYSITLHYIEPYAFSILGACLPSPCAFAHCITLGRDVLMMLSIYLNVYVRMSNVHTFSLHNGGEEVLRIVLINRYAVGDTWQINRKEMIDNDIYIQYTWCVILAQLTYHNANKHITSVSIPFTKRLTTLVCF